MKKTQINDFWFYKYRYQLGIGIISLGYLAMVLYTLFIAPNGLTQNEISSAQSSANLDFSNIFSKEIVDLPYRILQKISISIFGLSNFSIKLPSVILSLLSLLGIAKLAGFWFPKRTALLASLVAITSSQFFFLLQNGTSEILYILYPVLLILNGFKFLRSPRKQQIITLSILLGISFYTPLTIYIALALLITILAHPHFRFIITRSKREYKIIAGIAFFITLLPLLIAIIFDISIIKDLFGVPNSLNIIENSKTLFGTLFGFENDIPNGVVSPIISPAIAILIIIGFYFTFAERYSVRSYMVHIWTILLFIVGIINPATTSILFIPILILTIAGLQGLIDTWYAIFPKNPYARVVGLIPTSILIFNLLILNLSTFSLSYLYSPVLVSSFSQDLKILLENTQNNRILMVTQNEKGFYNILVKQNKALIASEFKSDEIILSKSAYESIKIPKNYHVKKILTSSRKNNADRFYVLSKS